MHIDEIIWKDTFVEKLARKHQVQIDEAEEALQSNPFIRRVKKGHVKGEDVYSAQKQIQSGRYVIVFFIRKQGRKILPISARDMDQAERSHVCRTFRFETRANEPHVSRFEKDSQARTHELHRR